MDQQYEAEREAALEPIPGRSYFAKKSTPANMVERCSRSMSHNNNYDGLGSVCYKVTYFYTFLHFTKWCTRINIYNPVTCTGDGVAFSHHLDFQS